MSLPARRVSPPWVPGSRPGSNCPSWREGKSGRTRSSSWATFDGGGPDAQIGVALNGGAPIPFVAGLVGGTQVAQTSDTGDDGQWMQLQIAIQIPRAAPTPTRRPTPCP